MRIGEALERLLSPQGSGEDDRSVSTDESGAFRAHMDAAIARERARRAPRADDHAAAIVLDPRLVLSLQTHEKTEMQPEPINRRDAQGVARDSSAIDTVQPQKSSRPAERDEAESASVSEPTERADGFGDADAASDPRAERTNATDESTSEPVESAIEPGVVLAPETVDGTDLGFERAPLPQTGDGAPIGMDRTPVSARRVLESVAASSDGVRVPPEVEPTGAIVREAARFSAADAAVPLDAQTARSGVSLDKPQSHDASESVTPALDAPDTSAHDFGAASDDQRDTVRDDPLAAAGIELEVTVTPAGTRAPASASFATTLLDETRATVANARPHTTGALVQGPPASPHAAAPVERDAVLSLLSERVAAALRTGQREVIVRLSPPDLGTLRVRFSIDEQRLSARVEVSDPAVHRALEAGVADLRGALLRQDVELRSLTFAAAEHDGHEDARSQRDTRDAHDHHTPEARDVGTTTSPAIRRGRIRSTGLDITA